MEPLPSFKNYLNTVNEIFEMSKLDNLNFLVDRLNSHFHKNGRIFLAGNGGSAAIASHAATDLNKLRHNNNSINAISLNENISSITAYSNDDSYENYLVNIIQNFQIQKSDTLVVISSSGNSLNIINLVNFCKDFGVVTFGLVGFNGGKLDKIVDYSILLKSKDNYYGPVEDLHMMIFHYYAHIVKNDLDELRVN